MSTPRAGTSPADRVLADTLPDDVLTDRARDGDTAAFAVLLRRHQQPMFALALRLTGVAADAEDAVQAAFTTAWRALPGFRGDARFSTWLHRIVTNQALSLLRRRRASDPLPEDDRAPAVPAHRGPEASAEHSALATALAGAVAALPDDLRVVWVLREVEHCSYDDIAAAVGQSASTVRGRLARARKTLADTLAEWR